MFVISEVKEVDPLAPVLFKTKSSPLKAVAVEDTSIPEPVVSELALISKIFSVSPVLLRVSVPPFAMSMKNSEVESVPPTAKLSVWEVK